MLNGKPRSGGAFLLPVYNPRMHITQYWQGPEPENLAAILASYRAHNPGAHYRLYDRAAAAAFIGEHYGARESSAFRQCAVPAMQADYFRYCAVLALGGFYVDADMSCLAPMHISPGFDGLLYQRENGNVINAFLGFRAPGHPLLAAALEIATRGIEQRYSNDVWLVTGPGIFTYLRYMTVSELSKPPTASKARRVVTRLRPGWNSFVRSGLRAGCQLNQQAQ